MSPLSVPAIYDGKQIRLLGAAPVQERYHVLVTFVEPAREQTVTPHDLSRFWATFGAWRDGRPVSETLRSIYEARRSKAKPPIL